MLVQSILRNMNSECPRRLLGEGLGSCSIEELHQIEQQLEKSVGKIRARKVNLKAIKIHDFHNIYESQLIRMRKPWSVLADSSFQGTNRRTKRKGNL